MLTLHLYIVRNDGILQQAFSLHVRLTAAAPISSDGVSFFGTLISQKQNSGVQVLQT